MVLIEDSLFFGDERYPCEFHWQKRMLHRASMRAFWHSLHDAQTPCHYLDYDASRSLLDELETLKQDGCTHLLCADVADTLRKNPRWAMMVSRAEAMDENKKAAHLACADAFLQNLHHQ